MTREELINNICPECNKYNCDDRRCEDCDEQLNKWLDEYDKQIRTDAIDDCVNKLKLEFHPCLNCISYSTDECNTEDYFQDSCVTDKTISFADIFKFIEQLKEQK